MLDFKRLLIVCVGVLFGCFSISTLASAEELQVSLRTGSLIGVQVISPTLSWLNVQPDGNTVEQTISLGDVRELLLIKNPESEKLQLVKQLLHQLKSDEFVSREEAERQLSDPDVVGDMTPVIREERKTADLETSIRIERILWALNDFEQSSSDEVSRQMDLDVLILNDGTQLRGDASGLELDCLYRDQQLKITRDQMLRISRPSEPGKPQNSVAAAVKIYNQPAGFYGDPSETLIDFETDPFGNNLNLRDDLHETFQTSGFLMHAEQRGHIGSVRYPFKLCPLDVQSKKSGAVVNGDSRFRGIAGFSFCLPGQPSAPAGVDRFGVFIERVDHSRDIIVEAYDELGQILGMVEATDEKCVFAGFESNVPIARVRILQNPLLIEKGLGRDIDQLYAFDNIIFGQPVPIRAYSVVTRYVTVRLRNGDVISPVQPENLKINEDSISIPSPVDSGLPLELPINEVESILQAMPGSSNSNIDNKSWMVMLNDQLIVRVQPGTEFVATDFGELTISRDQIVGLWPADQPARYPVAGDTDAGKPVIVFASCRINADQFKMDETKFWWDPKSRKTVQNVNIQSAQSQGNPPEEPDPDLTPKSSEFAFDSRTELPTVWFETPKTNNPDLGKLVLIDGQQWVLGGTTGFQLESLDSSQAVVSIDGQTRQIPFSNIASIVFPGPKQK